MIGTSGNPFYFTETDHSFKRSMPPSFLRATKPFDPFPMNCASVTAAWGHHRQGSCQAGFSAAVTQVSELSDSLIFPEISGRRTVCVKVEFFGH